MQPPPVTRKGSCTRPGRTVWARGFSWSRTAAANTACSSFQISSRLRRREGCPAVERSHRRKRDLRHPSGQRSARGHGRGAYCAVDSEVPEYEVLRRAKERQHSVPIGSARPTWAFGLCTDRNGCSNSGRTKKGKVTLTTGIAHWWILPDAKAKFKEPIAVEGGKAINSMETFSTAYIDRGHTGLLWKNELYDVQTGNAGYHRLQQFGIFLGVDRARIRRRPSRPQPEK